MPCEILPIVKETVKFMRASLPATIEIRERFEQVGMVVADPTQIHQVVMNLCTNAAHAMESGGGVLEVVLTEVDVDAAETQLRDLAKGRYVLLSVSDTGTGMPPEVRERIFEPYFTTKPAARGPASGSRSFTGSSPRRAGGSRSTASPALGRAFTSTCR